VLVTGASGFIGSHLVEELLNKGADVRAFVRYTSNGKIGNLEYLSKRYRKEIELFFGDLKDPYTVRRALKDINYVFHLASLISIPYSYINPREYFDNNITFILNILQAAEELGTDFIVHTSTSEVYGTAQYVPIDENHPLVGQSPYSASKIGADKVAESFYRSFNSPVSTLRPFNTYGPRQSTRAVIPTIINQLLTGDDLHLGDITTTRDFLYVKDTIQGFIKMVENKEKTMGKVLNIGTSREVTIETVAKYLIEIINPKAKILLNKDKLRPEKSEVRRLCAKTEFMKDLTGWKPNYSLEDGLKETVTWFKEYKQMYSVKNEFK
jgi:NAD dependent epimerase/dehydratase